MAGARIKKKKKTIVNVLKSHTVETEWVGAITKNIVVVATAWCPWSYINKWTKGKVVSVLEMRGKCMDRKGR